MATTSDAVLIVDDDSGIRLIYRRALEKEGYEVFTASNGREALDFLDSMPVPSLIVLDLVMPVMDGMEFLEEKAKIPRLSDVPVVVASAFEDLTTPIKANVILLKPVPARELVATVKRAAA